MVPHTSLVHGLVSAAVLNGCLMKNFQIIPTRFLSLNYNSNIVFPPSWHAFQGAVSSLWPNTISNLVDFRMEMFAELLVGHW